MSTWSNKYNTDGTLDWSPTVYCEELGEEMTPDFANDMEARLQRADEALARAGEAERDARSWRNACLDADGVVVDEVEFGYRVIKRLQTAESQLAERDAEIARLKAELEDYRIGARLLPGLMRPTLEAVAAQAARGALADEARPDVERVHSEGIADRSDWLRRHDALTTPDAGKSSEP